MMIATATSLQLQKTSCTFVANSTDLVMIVMLMATVFLMVMMMLFLMMIAMLMTMLFLMMMSS